MVAVGSGSAALRDLAGLRPGCDEGDQFGRLQCDHAALVVIVKNPLAYDRSSFGLSPASSRRTASTHGVAVTS